MADWLPSWSCPACTLLNTHTALICDACSAPKPDSSQFWSCDNCSYSNPLSERNCVVCGVLTANAGPPPLEETQIAPDYYYDESVFTQQSQTTPSASTADSGALEARLAEERKNRIASQWLIKATRARAQKLAQDLSKARDESADQQHLLTDIIEMESARAENLAFSLKRQEQHHKTTLQELAAMVEKEAILQKDVVRLQEVIERQRQGEIEMERRFKDAWTRQQDEAASLRDMLEASNKRSEAQVSATEEERDKAVHALNAQVDSLNAQLESHKTRIAKLVTDLKRSVEEIHKTAMDGEHKNDAIKSDLDRTELLLKEAKESLVHVTAERDAAKKLLEGRDGPRSPSPFGGSSSNLLLRPRSPSFLGLPSPSSIPLIGGSSDPAPRTLSIVPPPPSSTASPPGSPRRKPVKVVRLRMCGWLEKKESSFFRPWHRKYYRFRGSTLYCYTDLMDRFCESFLRMPGCKFHLRPDRPKEHRIVITVDEQSLQLKAESEAELKKWVKAIEEFQKEDEARIAKAAQEALETQRPIWMLSQLSLKEPPPSDQPPPATTLAIPREEHDTVVSELTAKVNALESELEERDNVRMKFTGWPVEGQPKDLYGCVASIPSIHRIVPSLPLAFSGTKTLRESPLLSDVVTAVFVGPVASGKTWCCNQICRSALPAGTPTPAFASFVSDTALASERQREAARCLVWDSAGWRQPLLPQGVHDPLPCAGVGEDAIDALVKIGPPRASSVKEQSACDSLLLHAALALSENIVLVLSSFGWPEQLLVEHVVEEARRTLGTRGQRRVFVLHNRPSHTLQAEVVAVEKQIARVYGASPERAALVQDPYGLFTLRCVRSHGQTSHHLVLGSAATSETQRQNMHAFEKLREWMRRTTPAPYDVPAALSEAFTTALPPLIVEQCSLRVASDGIHLNLIELGRSDPPPFVRLIDRDVDESGFPASAAVKRPATTVSSIPAAVTSAEANGYDLSLCRADFAAASISTGWRVALHSAVVGSTTENVVTLAFIGPSKAGKTWLLNLLTSADVKEGRTPHLAAKAAHLQPGPGVAAVPLMLWDSGASDEPARLPGINEWHASRLLVQDALLCLSRFALVVVGRNDAAEQFLVRELIDSKVAIHTHKTNPLDDQGQPWAKIIVVHNWREVCSLADLSAAWEVFKKAWSGATWHRGSRDVVRSVDGQPVRPEYALFKHGAVGKTTFESIHVFMARAGTDAGRAINELALVFVADIIALERRRREARPLDDLATVLTSNLVRYIDGDGVVSIEDGPDDGVQLGLSGEGRLRDEWRTKGL